MPRLLADPPQPRGSLPRDIAALVLLAAGIGGLLAVAYMFDPLAAFAVLSLLLIAGGIILGRYEP